ncbi:MAG: hypothetical protein D6731_17595 [Planctomycetota bacterium]|nr:MAG: hypothetical protein D6731_17595 [Planctomycetota bacterium]
MSRTLWMREVRRLAPFGTGSLLWVYGSRLAYQPPPQGLPEDVFLVPGACLLAPLLLGAISVAPEARTGALAFLRRQPLSLSRQYLVRVTAALAWLLPSWLLLCADSLFAVQAPPPVTNGGPGVWASLWALAFGAGLLASTIAFEALSALFLALAFGLVGSGLLLAADVLVLGMAPLTPQAVALAAFVFAGSALASSYVAFVRGELQHRSVRPLMLGTTCLAGALGLGLLGTAAAQAYTVRAVVAQLPLGGDRSRAGGRLAVSLQGATWAGDEDRVAVFARGGDAPRVLDVRGVRRPVFSPDGGRLLLFDRQRRARWLYDLDRGARAELVARPGTSFDGGEVLWTDAGPLLLAAGSGSLAAFDPRTGESNLASLPKGMRLAGVRPGAHPLVLHDAQRLYAADCPRVPARSEADLAIEPAARLGDGSRSGALSHWAEVVLSPNGRYALCRDRDAARPLVLFDLVTPEAPPRRLPLAAPSAAAPRAAPAPREAVLSIIEDGRTVSRSVERLRLLGTYSYGWDPSERRLALESPGGTVFLFDLESGRRAVLQSGRRSFPGRALAWSPSGRILALPSGAVVDVDSARLLGHAPVYAFLDEERVLLRGHRAAPLSLASALAGGAP